MRPASLKHYIPIWIGFFNLDSYYLEDSDTGTIKVTHQYQKTVTTRPLLENLYPIKRR